MQANLLCSHFHWADCRHILLCPWLQLLQETHPSIWKAEEPSFCSLSVSLILSGIHQIMLPFTEVSCVCADCLPAWTMQLASIIFAVFQKRRYSSSLNALCPYLGKHSLYTIPGWSKWKSLSEWASTSSQRKCCLQSSGTYTCCPTADLQKEFRNMIRIRFS